jgi:stearoyl-CoA desaturase (delta-9 desaturase)
MLKSLKRALVRIGYGAEADRARVAEALKPSKPLQVAVSMREELIALWERSHASKEQLLRQLQDWCHRAEASGIAPLVDFSRRLRSYA